jgi:hypothetical protein
MENPKTKKKEWMASAQYEQKGNSGLKVTQKADGSVEFSQGGEASTVDFLVPYKDIKEPLDRNYTFVGMDKYKEQPRKDIKLDANTEDKINQFMSKNKITDRNEAIKILKANKIIQ